MRIRCKGWCIAALATAALALAPIAQGGDSALLPSGTREALSARRDTLTFDCWSILQYWRDGPTRLRFRQYAPTGESSDLEYTLSLALKHTR